MSSERRDNHPPQSAPPVYTIYPVPASPGTHPNFSYGPHQTNPHAPPPKYEDVVCGGPGEPRATAQPVGTYEGPGQAGVILVAPVYKYTKAQRCLGMVVGLLLAVSFISVFIKILGVRSHY